MQNKTVKLYEGQEENIPENQTLLIKAKGTWFTSCVSFDYQLKELVYWFMGRSDMPEPISNIEKWCYIDDLED